MTPNLRLQLSETLAVLRENSSSLNIAPDPNLKTDLLLGTGSTPDPFHSDDWAPIGREHANIRAVVIKALELVLGKPNSKVSMEFAREETLQHDHSPIKRQCWVIGIKRKGRPTVYLKGLFPTITQVVTLLSLHTSEIHNK